MNQTKKQSLEEIFRKNNNEGIAIAITGSWGIGKTFFWKGFLEKQLSQERAFRNEKIFNRKYAYVSLFGLESLSDLKTQIYSNIENNHSSIEVPKWLKGLPAIFKDTRINQLGISAPAKLIDTLMFSQVKDAIICFDDFERMSNKLDIKDVMGLANQLKLEKKCQVILILDEAKAEGHNKEKYAEYKEKLIDETIKITSVEPLIRENTKGIDEPLVDLMVKFADELEIHNFRFFQKVIKLYKQFREQLPQKVAESTKKIILIRILQGYFIEDFGKKYEFGWKDIKLVIEEKQVDWSERKLKTYESLKLLSYNFIHSDEWFVEFKKWFEQIDQFNFDKLQELAQSELISQNNQNLKSKIWNIFKRRFNFQAEERDFEFLSTIGQEMIAIETIYNTSVAYEFIKKYLSDESKSKQFEKDVLKVIDADIGKAISRKNKEFELWGNPNNIFYAYIEQCEKNYTKSKSLKEIVSYYLQYDTFNKDSEKDKLKEFVLDDWYHYLTVDIYLEEFIIEKDKTIIACLQRLSKIQGDDFDLKNMIIKVLNKIGEESEFKKRYMLDIIENHLD